MVSTFAILCSGFDWWCWEEATDRTNCTSNHQGSKSWRLSLSPWRSSWRRCLATRPVHCIYILHLYMHTCNYIGYPDNCFAVFPHKRSTWMFAGEGWEGPCQLPHGWLSVRVDHFGVRLVCKHGAFLDAKGKDSRNTMAAIGFKWI